MMGKPLSDPLPTDIPPSSQLAASPPVRALDDPVAENMLLMQTASGGWPKHHRGRNVDYERRYDASEVAELRDPARHDDATLDNDATTTEIRYLIGVWHRTGQTRYLDAAGRGVEYLLAAQYANGGWPQFHPDRSGYRRHITFNDDAMVQAIALLQDVAEGRGDFAVLQGRYGVRALEAVQRGIDCILATQVVLDGVPTIWAQQYHADTLQPAHARAYELPSLSTSESVGILRLLMRQPDPSPRIRQAIVTATQWLQAHRLPDLALRRIDDPAQETGRDVIVVKQPGASLWARYYDLETQQPLFADRDGLPRTTLAEVSNERRTGYAWYGTWPEPLLRKALPRWQAANPEGSGMEGLQK
ncbi:pectate lyase [Lysobacter alkalisoli]|uniref:Pectate lyase n=2 Tax=Marilutibacter alkalisoli TaxID=2591633 RepID=A0A514BW52_9GAMM|nr:pectate lyase [Lysobacter alkalisoli]